MSDEIAIRVRGLKTAYGTHIVHEQLDLDVRKGEVIGIIGPSGCGKSVLLRAIVGLKRPAEGSVEIFGQEVIAAHQRDHSVLQKLWGVMFQDGALFSNLTVQENVMVPMREHADLPVSLMRELANQKLRMAGLETWTGRKYPSDLSGGMRKRAALARAMALDPPLLFLDEPTAGLDPITAAGFDLLVRELQETLDLTVFLVTHDVDTLRDTCDRIAVLGERRVIAVDTIDALRQYEHPWIQDYFGGPRGRAAMAGVA